MRGGSALAHHHLIEHHKTVSHQQQSDEIVLAIDKIKIAGEYFSELQIQPNQIQALLNGRVGHLGVVIDDQLMQDE